VGHSPLRQVDPYLDKIEELVERSHGKVRAVIRRFGGVGSLGSATSFCWTAMRSGVDASGVETSSRARPPTIFGRLG